MKVNYKGQEIELSPKVVRIYGQGGGFAGGRNAAHPWSCVKLECGCVALGHCAVEVVDSGNICYPYYFCLKHAREKYEMEFTTLSGRDSFPFVVDAAYYETIKGTVVKKI